MKIEEYNEIIQYIRNFKGAIVNCSRMLEAHYSNLNQYALNSILTQEVQLKMKATHYKVFSKNVTYYDVYLKSLENGEPIGILLRLANTLDTCPALLATNVLKGYFNSKEVVSRADINKIMRDTQLLENGRLAYEIMLCNIYDCHYGPLSTAMSESIGEEYEVKLENYLTECQIPYYNEHDLRRKGYDKTPDTKLEVPIAVNGFVINWIESKAQFGSPEIHEKYIKKQFLSYWNRFGPGLVIYWFGFVDNITQPTESRFIIMDHFPENITYMNPDSIKSTLF